MNLGEVEAALLPAVRRAVGEQANAYVGPPVRSAATGMKFDVWVHAARYQDLGGVTAEGAVVARRPVQLGRGVSGFIEERPACIVVEVTCTGPSYAVVQNLCGSVASVVLLALETMPPPELSLPSTGTTLRFSDFSACVDAAVLEHRASGEAAWWFAGVVSFRLDGFLHVTLTQRGGVRRAPTPAPPVAASIRMKVLQGPPGADVSGEHVVIRNGGAEEVRLGGYVLRDAAPKRPHRFVLPAVSLSPGAELRIWTGKGKNDSENLYWGRTKSVWNAVADRAVLVDPAGSEAARVSYVDFGGGRS